MQGTASITGEHLVFILHLALKCFTLTGKRKCTKIFEKKKSLRNSWKRNVYDKISYKSFT